MTETECSEMTQPHLDILTDGEKVQLDAGNGTFRENYSLATPLLSLFVDFKWIAAWCR